MLVIDLVVDIYNVISICYVVLVGGENLVVYCGELWLVIVCGDELFDMLKLVELVVEYLELGEVIWWDDIGVIC